MPKASKNRELAFTINDVARLLRTYADQKAAQFGVTRAKWAVLSRLQRSEGLKQAELAEMLDVQPITLTRLLDGLASNGLIERRPDPDDRRANRLYLTPAARPLLESLGVLAEELMDTALANLKHDDIEAILTHFEIIKDNLRQAIAKKSASLEKNYG